MFETEIDLLKRAGDKKELTRIEKIKVYCFAKLLEGILIIMMPKIREHQKRKHDLKNKLRHFNPIIKEGLLGTRIDWVGRDKPLTDEELNNLTK